MGFFDKLWDAAKSPFSAANRARKDVQRGDIKGALKNSLSSYTALNPLAKAEMIAGRSPTGFGQVASGDTSPDALRKLAISSAAAAGGAASLAYAGGGVAGFSAGATVVQKAASGDLLGAGLSAANIAAPNLSVGGLVPSEVKDGYNALKPFLPSLSMPEAGAGGQPGEIMNVPVLQPESSGMAGGLIIIAALGGVIYLAARR